MHDDDDVCVDDDDNDTSGDDTLMFIGIGSVLSSVVVLCRVVLYLY